MTNRRDFLKKSAVLAVAAAGVGSAPSALAGSQDFKKKTPVQEKKKQPNIVFFLSDQHRRQAMGFWKKEKYRNALNGTSDPVHTPFIDAFAEESVVLTQCISSTPVCSPHRGMMLSGMLPHANGVPWNCRIDREWGLINKLDTLGVVLSRNNYSCGYIGKWHLDKPEPNDPANPGKYIGESDPHWTKPLAHHMDSYTPPEYRQGFDYWYAYGTKDDHADPHYYDTDGKRHEPGVWATTHEVDMAISYLKNDRQQRVEGNPFCLFVSTHPPHSRYIEVRDTDPEMYDQFYSPEKIADAKSLLNRPNLGVDGLPIKMTYSTREPSEKSIAEGKGPSEDVARIYFSSVTGVDRQFGRLLQALKESGQLDNTIVVYSADHGEMLGSHKLMEKSVIYEEALGIPMIIRYPQKLKPSVNDVLMGSMDIMPTLLGLAGLGDKIPAAVDGHDLSGYLAGTADKQDKPTFAPYMLHTEQKGLRTDRYSFVMNREGEGALFDNINDPYQLNNIFNEQPEIVKELGKTLGAFLRNSDDLWFQERINKDLIQYT